MLLHSVVVLPLASPWPGGLAPGGLVSVVIAAWIGALFGSLSGVIAGRWPAHVAWEWRRGAREVLGLPVDDADAEPPNWIRGRSRCNGCCRTLTWWENIPFVAWLLLRGRCRTCGSRIGPHLLLLEVIGAGAMAMAWTHGVGLIGAGLLMACVPFWLAGAAVDAVSMLLPGAATIPPLFFGLVSACLPLTGAPTPAMALAGAVLGWGLPTALNGLTRLIRGQDGMGEGDAWVLAGFGAWLGPAAVPVILGLAAVVSLLWFLPAIVRHRRDPSRPLRVPFGPGLIAVGGLLVLGGPRAVPIVFHFLFGTPAA